MQAITALPRVPALFLQARLLTLSGVDIAIITLYFITVLGIGFYLKRYTKTGEDFFLAGREMTAWVAGLSFLAAVFGMVLVSRRLSADIRWVAFAHSALLLAWGGVAAAVVLYMLIEPLGGLGLGGLAQRVFWTLTLTWLSGMALRLGPQGDTRRLVAAHPA